MAFVIVCMHCHRKILTVPAIGEREANILLTHLANSHASVLDASTSLGDLLQNFTISRQSPA